MTGARERGGGGEGRGPAPGIGSTEALARHLGLSRWTVSRVLNGHGGVRAETEERVLRAVRESGFEPNPFARSLRGAATGTVGVCIQELDSPSLSRKAGSLQAFFREQGFRCLLELTNRDRALEEKVLRHFLALRVEGIIGIGSRLAPGSELDRELRGTGIPVVMVDPETDLSFPTVEVDRAGATESMLGCKRPVICLRPRLAGESRRGPRW